MDLYSALFAVPHTQGAHVWITQFYLVSVHQMAELLSCDGVHLSCLYCTRKSVKKVKEVELYSAFIVVLTLNALRYGSHSVTCKLHRTCLYLVSIYQMAHPQTEVADI